MHILPVKVSGRSPVPVFRSDETGVPYTISLPGSSGTNWIGQSRDAALRQPPFADRISSHQSWKTRHRAIAPRHIQVNHDHPGPVVPVPPGPFASSESCPRPFSYEEGVKECVKGIETDIFSSVLFMIPQIKGQAF